MIISSSILCLFWGITLWEANPMSGVFQNINPPPPHPQASVPCPPTPRNQRGKGISRLRRVREWGGPNSNFWRKSLVLCLLFVVNHLEKEGVVKLIQDQNRWLRWNVSNSKSKAMPRKICITREGPWSFLTMKLQSCKRISQRWEWQTLGGGGGRQPPPKPKNFKIKGGSLKKFILKVVKKN